MIIVNEVHELTAVGKVTACQKCFIIILSWWINFYDQVDQSQFTSFSGRSILKWCCLQQLYHMAIKTSCSFLKVHNIPFISCLLYCNPALYIWEFLWLKKQIIPAQRKYCLICAALQTSLNWINIFFIFFKLIFNVFVIKLIGAWVLKKNSTWLQVVIYGNSSERCNPCNWSLRNKLQ